MKLLFILLFLVSSYSCLPQSLDTIYHDNYYGEDFKINRNSILKLSSNESLTISSNHNILHFQISNNSSSPDIIWIDLYTKDSVYTASLWDLSLKSSKPYVATKPYQKVLPPSTECEYRPYYFEYRTQDAYGNTAIKQVLFGSDGKPVSSNLPPESIYSQSPCTSIKQYKITEPLDFPHVIYEGKEYLKGKHRRLKPYCNDLFLVSNDSGSKFGIVDLHGKELIPLVWDKLIPIENSSVLYGYKGLIQEENLCEIAVGFDENGEVVSYEKVNIPVYSTNWYLLDLEGNEIPLQFD